MAVTVAGRRFERNVEMALKAGIKIVEATRRSADG